MHHSPSTQNFSHRNLIKLSLPKKLMPNPQESQEQSQAYSGQQFFSDMNTRLRDIEEKQRILKDRILLIGESLIKEREKSFSEISEMKKSITILKAENTRMKQFLQRITELTSQSAKKTELDILQKQFDLFRE
jgi:predicted nuclease with TOPRIM domain